MIRLILLVILLYLLFAWMRRSQRQNAGANVTTEKSASSRMVKCEYCSVHITQEEAVMDENSMFCSHEHKQKALSGQNGKPE